MAWVDLDYYKNGYLMGSTPNIADTDFAFWESQAESKLNRQHVVVDEPQECLKNCTCKVAELLHKSKDNPSKTLDADIRSARTEYLSGTVYHNDFVFAGI